MRAMKSLVIMSLLLLHTAVATQAATANHRLPYRPGELLIKFKPSMRPIDRSLLLQRAQVHEARSLGESRIHLLKLTTGLSVNQACEIYKGHPDVVFAEPNYILTAQAETEDPYFSRQWALQNTGQIVAGYTGTPGSDVEATAAWSITPGNSTVVVAVVDTGCNLNHPDLTTSLWTNGGEIPNNGLDDDLNGFIDDYYGWDVVDQDNDPSDVTGHGTHVAGIIAAQGNNQIGVAGLAWQTRIMPVRFMDAFERGTTADAIAAIAYAARQGARIINCSWGGGDHSAALRDAMANTDALFVCAAGNSAENNDDAPFYPASYDAPNIISVAASDQMDRLTWFSNSGTQSVDVAAPGIRIYSATNSRRTIWQDDFSDEAMTAWTTGGHPDSWTIANPPYTVNAPALATNAAGNYANQADMWARSPAMDLSEAVGCTLHFRLVGTTQSNADRLLLEASTNGNDWHACPLWIGSAIWDNGISGAIAYWMPVKADLGFLDGQPQAYIRLRFISDIEHAETGYYIDDLSLMAAAVEDVYTYMQGTSMAAGFVSGLAALVVSQDGESTPQQIKDIIETSVDLDQALLERVMSGGRINAFNALTLIEQLSLSADTTAKGDIQLSWTTDPTQRFDSELTIERRRDDQDNFATVAQVKADAHTYLDSAITSDTTYYYRIQAATADGDAGYSNQSFAIAGQSTDSSSGSSGGGCFIVSGSD